MFAILVHLQFHFFILHHFSNFILVKTVRDQLLNIEDDPQMTSSHQLVVVTFRNLRSLVVNLKNNKHRFYTPAYQLSFSHHPSFIFNLNFKFISIIKAHFRWRHYKKARFQILHQPFITMLARVLVSLTSKG